MGEFELRQRLGQQIMDICSGQPTAESLAAQADALATSIGGLSYLGGMSLTEAGGVLNELYREMQAHLIRNWGQIARGDH